MISTVKELTAHIGVKNGPAWMCYAGMWMKNAGICDTVDIHTEIPEREHKYLVAFHREDGFARMKSWRHEWEDNLGWKRPEKAPEDLLTWVDNIKWSNLPTRVRGIDKYVWENYPEITCRVHVPVTSTGPSRTGIIATVGAERVFVPFPFEWEDFLAAVKSAKER